MSDEQKSLATSARVISIDSWLPLMRQALFHQLRYNDRQASSTANCSMIYGPVRALFDDGTMSKTHWHADACLWENGIFFDGGTFLLPSNLPQGCLDDYVVDFDLSTGIHHVNFPALSFRTDTSQQGNHAFNSETLLPEHIAPSIQDAQIATPSSKASGLTSTNQLGDIVNSQKSILDLFPSNFYPVTPSKHQSHNNLATIDAHQAASRFDFEDLFADGQSDTGPKSETKNILSLSAVEDEIFSRMKGCTPKADVSALPFPDNAILSHGVLVTSEQLNKASLASTPAQSLSEDNVTASAQDHTICGSHKAEKERHRLVSLSVDKFPGSGSTNARIASDKNFRELRIDIAPNLQHNVPLSTGQTSDYLSAKSTGTIPTPATTGTSVTFMKPLRLPDINIALSVSKIFMKPWVPLRIGVPPAMKATTLDALDLAGKDQEQGAWEYLSPPWLNLQISQRQYDDWEEIKERVDSNDWLSGDVENVRDPIHNVSLGKDIPELNPAVAPTIHPGTNRVQYTNYMGGREMVSETEVIASFTAAKTVYRELVQNLPSFTVGTVTKTHSSDALDILGFERLCKPPVPELESPSSYLDIESRTISKQPFELGQYGENNVGETRQYEPQIILHEASGELYIGQAPLKTAGSDLTSEVADLPLRFEDIDLDIVFGQSATELDDEVPPENGQGSLEQSDRISQGEGAVASDVPADQGHRVWDDLARLGSTMTPSPSRPRSGLSTKALNKPPLPFLRSLDRHIPVDLLDEINCKFHRLWYEGTDGTGWTPGSDEVQVRRLAMNSVIQDQAGIPTNFADMAKDYSEVYQGLKEAGEQDGDQAKKLTTFNLQWKYLRKDLDNSRLPLQSQNVLEPAPSFLDWFLETTGEEGSFRKHRQVKAGKGDKHDPVDHGPGRSFGHHANFLDMWVPVKSNTPPAVSLFAVVTASRTRAVRNPYSRKAVVLSQAFKWVDPFVFEYDLLSIDWNLKGTALRDFATGRTAIAYKPFGTWLLDSYDEDEDLPTVANGLFEGVGSYDAYGQLKQYAGLQWPHQVQREDGDIFYMPSTESSGDSDTGGLTENEDEELEEKAVAVIKQPSPIEELIKNTAEDVQQPRNIKPVSGDALKIQNTQRNTSATVVQQPRPQRRHWVAAGDVLEAENSVQVPVRVMLAVGDVVEAENASDYGHDDISDITSHPDSRVHCGYVSATVGNAALTACRWALKKFRIW
ncbi:hypothetical protein N7G274_003186 [Stereocaulon virgatum]|uniref:Uncharacterized protein n=1 Tax=Stereocaulon virgatum TaxID=373712 RepID=A0ABR4AI06_9LECA